jgi:hypothetical protein
MMFRIGRRLVISVFLLLLLAVAIYSSYRAMRGYTCTRVDKETILAALRDGSFMDEVRAVVAGEELAGRWRGPPSSLAFTDARCGGELMNAYGFGSPVYASCSVSVSDGSGPATELVADYLVSECGGVRFVGIRR